MIARSDLPRVGMLATVRNRRGIIAGVDAFDAPPDGRLHLIRVEYIDSDGDPMPGGSGLLQQLVARWSEVCAAALTLTEDCPARCSRVCVSCLIFDRNAFYAASLDRHRAAAVLGQRGGGLELAHDIPESPGESVSEGRTANDGEARLSRMLERAGILGAQVHREIDLGRPLGGDHTRPVLR